MAGLWEQYDLDYSDDLDIYPARPEIDEDWQRKFVASFRLSNRRWPGTSEVLAAWAAHDLDA